LLSNAAFTEAEMEAGRESQQQGKIYKNDILKSKIISTLLVLLFSVVITIVVFILLTYTRITIGIVNRLMVVFGYDFYQGETRNHYAGNFILGIIASLSLIVLFFSNRWFFKKKKRLCAGIGCLTSINLLRSALQSPLLYNPALTN